MPQGALIPLLVDQIPCEERQGPRCLTWSTPKAHPIQMTFRRGSNSRLEVVVVVASFLRAGIDETAF